MRIDIPERKKLVFETTIPIRWGDMDAMGHLNNASYFRYLETTRIDWFHSLGLGPSPAGAATTIWVDFPKQKALPLPDWLRAIVSDD